MNWRLNLDYSDPSKIERPNLVEVGHLPKLVYRGNAFPSSAGKEGRKKKQGENRFFKKKRRKACMYFHEAEKDNIEENTDPSFFHL